VFSFVNNGDPQVYIGSSDMMHRNLDRRVEALVRLTSPDHIKELEDLLDLAMSEETSSWWLDSSGTWTRHERADDGTPLQDLQNVLMKQISQRKRGGALR
jgi:polyphosphate kinase